ncbi:MAG: hypothetical protein PHU14_07565 [Methylovulum sp.]|nr:hypothetical protein [Methylovulum sp.]
MSVEKLTIKLLGFSAPEMERFSAILALAESRLQQAWQMTTAEDADFFLLPSEQLKASLAADISAARCLFYTDDPAIGNLILSDCHKIPRINSLINVLNHRGAQKTIEITANAEAIPEPASPSSGESAPPAPIESQPAPSANDQPADTANFAPDHGLLSALLEHHATPILIKANTVVICVDPSQKLYYCPLSLTQLIPYFDPGIAPQVKPISVPEMQELVGKAKLPPQPLNNLIWYITFKTSQGRLLQGTAPEDIVRLLHWPDLTIPECGHYAKLAAFMHSNTMRLADIAKTTSYPPASVYDFYNACTVVGMTEKADTVQVHEKVADLKQQTVLRKIRDRLKF